MKDIQSLYDERNIKLQKVGVKAVHLPFMILEKTGNYQQVDADISFCADLGANERGTHMSRFMEILNQWSKKPMSSKEMKRILQEAADRLGAARAELSISFRYFIEKVTPMSEFSGIMDYFCSFRALLDRQFHFGLTLEVPVTTLCPCSKEISRYGAHNQRALVRLTLKCRPGSFLWIEDLIRQLESLGSSDLYSILKRSDEKYLTEHAYENPKFVEDVVRDAVILLSACEGVETFEVECEASESIHNHNAFAWQSGKGPEPRENDGQEGNLSNL